MQWFDFQLEIRVSQGTKSTKFTQLLLYKVLTVFFFVVIGVVNLFYKIVRKLAHVSLRTVFFILTNSLAVTIHLDASSLFRKKMVENAFFCLMGGFVWAGLSFKD